MGNDTKYFVLSYPSGYLCGFALGASSLAESDLDARPDALDLLGPSTTSGQFLPRSGGSGLGRTSGQRHSGNRLSGSQRVLPGTPPSAFGGIPVWSAEGRTTPASPSRAYAPLVWPSRLDGGWFQLLDAGHTFIAKGVRSTGRPKTGLRISGSPPGGDVLLGHRCGVGYRPRSVSQQ